MTAIVINDSMAVLRARLERDLARFSLRSLVEEMNRSPHVQIWVWDGAGNKDKRRKIYPAYKERRKPADPSIYQGMMLMKQVLKLAKGISIEVPGYEADDVIAALARKYAGACPVAINTRDYDLRALCSLHPTVTCTVDAKADVPDSQIQLFKAWVGDPSDNIPGVKGFGKGAWEKADKEELAALSHFALCRKGRPDYSMGGQWREYLAIKNRMATVDQKFVTWIDQNTDLFCAMWNVIGFLPISDEELSRHMVVGHPDAGAVDKLLGEYFL